MTSEYFNDEPTDAPIGEGSGPPGGDAQPTDALGDLGAFDPGSVSKVERRVHGQTIIIALVLVVGGGMLYAMRRYGMRSGFKFDTLEVVDYERDHTGKTDEQRDQILADLAASKEPVQVPVSVIDKNPFLLVAAQRTGTDTDPAINSNDEARRQAELIRQQKEQRRQEIERALAGLEINGVMGGTVPLASISGVTVRVGDTVAEYFTVVGIEGRSVRLEADGEVHVLTVGERGSSHPKRRW